ncbi:MAG: hypothetical protein WDN28_06440 [Chthoniobacter sp.]
MFWTANIGAATAWTIASVLRYPKLDAKLAVRFEGHGEIVSPHVVRERGGRWDDRSVSRAGLAGHRHFSTHPKVGTRRRGFPTGFGFSALALRAERAL